MRDGHTAAQGGDMGVTGRDIRDHDAAFSAGQLIWDFARRSDDLRAVAVAFQRRHEIIVVRGVRASKNKHER